MRWIRLMPVTLLAVVISGCSGASEPITVTVTPSVSAPAEAGGLASSGPQEAAKVFLAAVCPTDSALQAINESATASGGWLAVAPGTIHDLADWAVKQARTTSETLRATTWPDSVADRMPAVADEYLAMLRPLATLAETNSGQQLQEAWQYLNQMTRVAEEGVRVDLQLGPVDSKDDGCPPPTPVKPRPETTTSRPATSSGAWTQYWQSPSGNIRCGYTPQGSAGVPTVACLVSDENTLARLPQGGAPMVSSATESQRAQLPGGPTLQYGAFVTAGPFECWQSPPDGIGMTCTDKATGHGFAVKRGSFTPF